MSPVSDRLRAANPVPKPDAALTKQIRVKISLDIAQRTNGTAQRTDNSTQRTVDEMPYRDGGRSRAVLATVCLLVVTATVGIVMAANGPQNTEAASATPVELAQEYIAARNAWNAEKALSFTAPDAVISEFPIIQDRSEFPALIDYLRLAGETIDVSSCDPVLDQPGSVICYYEASNALMESEAGPARAGTLRISSDGTQITSITNTVDANPPLMPSMFPWFDWLDLKTSIGADALYRWTIHNDAVLPTPRLDNLEQFGSYLDEYLAATS